MGSNQPSPRPLTFPLTMVVSSNLAKSPLSERIGSRSRNSKGACAREREEFRRNFDGIFGRKRDERRVVAREEERAPLVPTSGWHARARMRVGDRATPTHRRVRHVDKGGETNREEKAR